jgi:hypothetical protein
VSVMDSLRVPPKMIQERIGHALTGSFTLDVYGHTLDWKANDEAAKELGDAIAKPVAAAEANLEGNSLNSALSTTLKKEKLPSSKLGSH